MTTVYKLMETLINGGKKSKAWLVNRANVYYAAGQLSTDEYEQIMAHIEEKYPVTEE